MNPARYLLLKNDAGCLTGQVTNLVLDGKVDEVGVYQDLVGRTQLAVVLEKQCS